MAVNVSGTVQVGGVNVSAQVGTHGVNATGTIQRSNTAVSASVEHRSANVSATAQTRNTNVCASVNPHIMPGGTSDHAQLQNLGYDESGHTGFQKQLNSDNAGTGIEITVDPDTNDVTISNTQTSAEWGYIEGNIANQTDLVEFVKSEHRTYYNNYTMYEGVAPYGSLVTDAVWTITTIVSNDVGGIVSVSTTTNQVWNYN